MSNRKTSRRARIARPAHSTPLEPRRVSKKEAQQEILALGLTCRGPLNEQSARQKAALLANGKREEAAAVDREGRQGCGYNFGEIVANGPLDGEEHPYTCPQCGVQGTYRAPRYDLTRR